jgi:hypothetical protein
MHWITAISMPVAFIQSMFPKNNIDLSVIYKLPKSIQLPKYVGTSHYVPVATTPVFNIIVNNVTVLEL